MVTHQQAGLAYFESGDATLHMHGQWRLGAGDVLLVPAGEPHRVVHHSPGRFYSIGFCVPCVAPSAAPAWSAPFERVRGGAAAVATIAPDRRVWMAALCGELLANAGADAARFPVQISLLTLILDEVARSASTGTRAAGPGGLAARALHIIETRCLGPLTPADVAATLKRSPAHLTTVVTEATGRSIGEWITAFRLAEARRLLLHTDLVMGEIGERVGYNDPTHFIRMFRREHAMTPAAWRRQIRRHGHNR